MNQNKDLYKVGGEYGVIIDTENSEEAEDKVSDATDGLMDLSFDAGHVSIKPPELKEINGLENKMRYVHGDFHVLVESDSAVEAEEKVVEAAEDIVAVSDRGIKLVVNPATLAKRSDRR